MRETMAQRIEDARRQRDRFLGTPYEDAARAYLAAQVEIAQRVRLHQPGGLTR